MSENAEVPAGPAIYAQLRTSLLDEHQRHLTQDAIRNAELISDGIVWIVRKLEHLGHRALVRGHGNRH